ncbi:MAG: hypothetical protein CBB81_03815 [Cellvibrionales bacterium TMED21]|nr:lysine transporter LysE [Halieaceae bacterium]OUT66520.1 MAG: hypothetical protein CBB81_03815 [Cellvibrionales bacterium TMED21]
MTPDLWLLLALTLFAGAASPGPSVALVIRTSLVYGRSGGVLVGLAHGLGVWLYALAVVLGVATLLVGNPWLLSSIQIAGIVFLAYLGLVMLRGGWVAMRATEPQEQAPVASSDIQKRSSISYLRDGFLIVFLNPKIVVFFMAIFSQFLNAEQTLATQLAAASLAGIIDAIWYVLVALLVSSAVIADRLQRYSGPIDILFGLLLLAVASVILIGML